PDKVGRMNEVVLIRDLLDALTLDLSTNETPRFVNLCSAPPLPDKNPSDHSSGVGSSDSSLKAKKCQARETGWSRSASLCLPMCKGNWCRDRSNKIADSAHHGQWISKVAQDR